MLMYNFLGHSISLIHLTVGISLAALCAAWVHEICWGRRLASRRHKTATGANPRVPLCRFHEVRLSAIDIGPLTIVPVDRGRCFLCR